ncbi:hypothetical protein GPECTOR_14g260 [Gonium pectorale]|uniref:non-specific serine/threonine protein kinase n=1 Tax=Gonium pectorale TaxID=33097 RepID=A0A150GNX0_GONPE|nr:hypothetical protein GPECTOR_14g260 [Gonium pectorale]|eukprot:KXZ51020.1 hypothetical protein GPECTOR_14g260 [Gonium pectorale]
MYNILLGKGACKRVYKALDTEEGTEVAWNQVDLLGMDRDEEARQHLHEEIRVLQTLKHKNIMTFYAWWPDHKNSHINFITELFTAGNLRQYRKKIKVLSENVLKRWAHQILEGLLYLHGHVPPIVHRDLKCDNIFVNSATGEIKIGDLGLATVQQQAMSVVGTPEFMAPEVYEESYDERCDIYSFGMCLLELATQEYPYAECHSVPQIFKKVTLGVPPASLARVSSQELREFISLCIAHNPADRPSARELLKHPYLEPVRSGQDTSAHGGSAGMLASLANGGSGTGTGWNTPTGTLHGAASFRDLREALHQQEALARLAAQQQHIQLNSHQSGLSPSGPTSPTGSAAGSHGAALGGNSASSDAVLPSAAAMVARSRASITGMLGAGGGSAPQLANLRIPSTTGPVPSQPSPLGRTASAMPPGEPPLRGSEESFSLSDRSITADEAASTPTMIPQRLPRSRLSGLCAPEKSCSSSSGVVSSVTTSPPYRQPVRSSTVPWAAGEDLQPGAGALVPEPDATAYVADRPCDSPAAQAATGPSHGQQQDLSHADAETPSESHAEREAEPQSQSQQGNGPVSGAPAAGDAAALEAQVKSPFLQRCDSCNAGQRTGNATSPRSGGSDSSDDDEEVLVPIELLKVNLVAAAS